ncbi:PBP1 and LysM peptidoglycan-binding domain-containing protein [Flavobacterium silvaticum]|uniref:LysM peptidoglycan-binding domain-containing protein n=1 Tax=Flavobacterium silvaticum TaxID=1852020 RepID=A0A972FLE7_9FLAO|nr:LysM peptidoglycan-binding domain-containing protein [Flavobacterium silvaticum]NMH27873.1 LysM peptidoglycan-binding domain-containing protein [Flavobacterium silvaticum]
MKCLVSFVTTLCFFVVSAQNDQYVKHKVQKSETVNQVAQKYHVTPAAIYRLNPDAYNGLKENQVLLIPSSSQIAETPSVQTEKPAATAVSESGSAQEPGTHLVKQGETLFSIARKYSVSVDALKKANPIVNDGLKTGQTLKIPGLASAKATTATPAAPVVKAEKPVAAKSSNSQTHIVQPGETKFSIAKRYGISVAELEKQNPAIKPGLPAGYTLHVVSETKPETRNETVAEKPKAVTTTIAETPVSETNEVSKSIKKQGYANYEVKPQETLFSLSQMFGITQDELIALNPNLKDGVRTGMILKVPGKGSINITQEREFAAPVSSYKNMTRKKLVLLLPFNASRITADTTNNTASRLKKDSFLNLTLDFYAGALMAIDSAKALGMNLDVRILDSEESKSGSSVLNLAKTDDLKNADAVIGPFYQQHAEKLAEALPTTAVISPLSKESGKMLPNLFQAMPSEQVTKKVMLDFLNSKNANVIVVNDPKRASNREFITANYPAFRFVEVDASGSVNADKVKAMLKKGVTNYIILDTERTGMILSATNAVLTEVANFPIQLVIIEPNDTLDFEEISMKRLTVLKLVYPSMTRDNDEAAAVIFRNAYKEKNKVFPSMYATRGFDVTFDAMMRLASGKTYADSALADKTQQAESKFDYVKNGDGFVNQGIYILQYNDDLSVKPAE